MVCEALMELGGKDRDRSKIDWVGNEGDHCGLGLCGGYCGK